MKIENRQITIEPLSPVFVWSGETLYSDFDFEVNGNNVTIIDYDKLISEAKSKEELESKSKFVKELYGVKLEFKNVSAGKRSINRILDINPYIIPGSEVKGLIRTAVINQLIKSDKNTFNETMNEISSRMNRLGNLAPRDKMKELRKIGQVAEGILKYNFPDPINYVYDALKTLMISDPTVQSAAFQLSEIDIVNIKKESKRESSIPVYTITFTKGRLTYDAKIVKPTNYGALSKTEIVNLDAEITWDLIVASLKNFSKVIIEDEKSKINEYKKHRQNEYHQKDDLNQYSEFMEKIQKINDCIVLKIGMFTGHSAKTIELRNDVKTKRENLLSSRRRRWDNSTLKITGGVGVGWIKMCIK